MIKRILLSVQFLTRLPLIVPGSADSEDISGSAVYFPLSGLLIAGILAAAYLIFSNLLPAFVASILVLFTYIFLTGALHFDGFADTVDGLYGGRKREDIFRIMDDSRIGAIGSTWLFMLILLYIALFTYLAGELVTALIAALVTSRTGAVLMMHLSRPAKQTGLAVMFCGKVTMIQTLFAFAIAAAVCGFLGWKALASLFIVILLAFFAAKYFEKKLGGITGDVLGFSIVAFEVSVLTFWLIKTI